MKIIGFAMVCALALGCGGKKSGATTSPDMPTTNTNTTGTEPAATGGEGGGHPCAHEIALECPEGQIDACLKTPPEGETHTCVAK